MQKFWKAAKAIGIIALIALVIWYFDSASQKRYQKEEDQRMAIYSKLYDISEGLKKIKSDCEIAEKFADYDSLEEEVGITIIRCEDLIEIADDLIDHFDW